MNRFSLTELQQTYRLGMDNSTFLGGNYPILYIETKIENFEEKKFSKALYAVLDNNNLLKCVLNEQGNWEESGTYPEIEFINGNENTADYICREKIAEYEKFILKVYVDKKENDSANVHFKFSGLVIDGMSMNIFLSQLKKAYNGLELPKTVDYYEYAKRLKEYSESSQYIKDIEIVRKAYENIQYNDFSMPVKADPFSSISGLHNSCVRMPVGRETFEKTEKLAKILGVSVFSVLITIYAKVISRFSGTEKFVLNVPCSARFRDMCGINDTAGLFSNYVNLPFNIQPELSVAELARDTGNRLMQIVKTARFIPGNRTTSLLGMPLENYSKNIIFTMLPFSNDSEDESFIINNWRIITNQALLETHILMQNGTPYISINYPDELFDKETISDIAEMFITAVKETVETGGNLTTLHLTSKTQSIIDKLNNVTMTIPDKTLTDILLEGFEKYADETLCIYKNREYTYSEIYKMTAVLGERIGSNPGVVMLILPKCAEQLASSYAVILSGGIYLPADISYSESEIEYCMKKTNAGTIITCASLRKKISDGYKGNIIIIDEIDWNDSNEFTPVKSENDDLCILINTSGTTGKPKSVMLHHKGIVNCLEYTPLFSGASQNDKIISLTNYCHDMAIFDTIGIFFFGGTIVIPDKFQEKEPSQWIELIKKYNITLWESVPSFIEMLMEYMNAENISEKLHQLKCIILGGEKLKSNVASFVKETFKNAVLYNVGGPSETTIWNIYHKVTEEDIENKIIPYGVPFPNTSYYIFNNNYEECPFGVCGTMYCSGVGLAKGYMGNPEETALKFTEKNGIRYYNTGDTGVRLRNGCLLILGRNDFQVKIHGKRIELTGIESILESHKDILRTSVIYIEKIGKIAAIYISEREIPADELYEYMKENIAEYMIPKFYFKADSIPLTRNGKIDKKAIEEFVLKKTEQFSAENKKTDNSSLREQIIELFEEELDCDIDKEEVSFYEIGGNSLSAVKIAVKLRKLVGKNISVFDMISSISIGEFIDELIE